MKGIPVTTRRALPRRRFLSLCAATAAAVGASPEMLARTGSMAKLYQRVALATENGARLRASDLAPGTSYIFNYPYVTTPAFLLDLGKPVTASVSLETEDGESYLWPGGVGTGRSIVAFSAICAHKMTHPARGVSFINYRHEEVSFRDREDAMQRRSGVILCCSEKSVYDPARGAEVLGGPARQPLCAILIEHDPDDDSLHAVGSFGGEMFDRFFESFSARLQLEWGTRKVRDLATGESRVWTAETYSRSHMLCG